MLTNRMRPLIHGEKVEFLENSKLIRAFGGWLNEQVAAIREQIWSNPDWEKVIMERRYEDLPKLMLAPPISENKTEAPR